MREDFTTLRELLQVKVNKRNELLTLCLIISAHGNKRLRPGKYLHDGESGSHLARVRQKGEGWITGGVVGPAASTEQMVGWSNSLGQHAPTRSHSYRFLSHSVTCVNPYFVCSCPALGCSSGGRAVAHQSVGRWFDSGSPGPHIEASLGKTLNPALPTDASIGV